MFAEFPRKSSDQPSSIIKKCFTEFKNSPLTQWLLVALVLLFPAVVMPGNPRVEQTRIKVTQHQTEVDMQRKADELATGRRWWAIDFYESTIYEPGDFPKEGYYQEDGTAWTPEVGGCCYDAQRDSLYPSNDIDYMSEKWVFLRTSN